MPLATWPVVDNQIVNYDWINHIGAVQIWDSVDAGVTLPAATISTPTLNGASGIAMGYTHLFMVWTARTNEANTINYIAWRFNGSTTNAYYQEGMDAVGAALTCAENMPLTYAKFGIHTCANAPAGNFGDGAIFWPQWNSQGGFGYAHYTAMSTASWGTTTGLMRTSIFGGLYGAGNPTTFQVLSAGPGSFVAGSRFTLYGMP